MLGQVGDSAQVCTQGGHHRGVEGETVQGFRTQGYLGGGSVEVIQYTGVRGKQCRTGPLPVIAS